MEEMGDVAFADLIGMLGEGIAGHDAVPDLSSALVIAGAADEKNPRRR